MSLLFRSAQWTGLRLALALLACWPAWSAARAQPTPAAIRGQITDPSGARVSGARVTLRSNKQPARAVISGQQGEFLFSSLSGGKYSLSIQSRGFRDQQRAITLQSGQDLTLSIQLTIEVDRQHISVSGQQLDSSPDHNLGAVVLRGSDLDALPSNSHDLQQLLTAMAGSPGAQFFIDGYTADHLPPKESIEEIRMNQDPYSAQYEAPGSERIEITTKPGGNKLHGNLEMIGEESPLNSKNPYVVQQPPYTQFFAQGGINGPLTKRSSWFLTGAQQNMGTQSFIHAITASTGPAYTQTLSSPQVQSELTPRIDFQAGKIQSFSLRYDIDREVQNNLVQSQLSLPAQAIDTRHLEQTFRLTDTQLYGPNLVNESRFQFIHLTERSLPHSLAPTLLVQGAFNAGGNNLGQARDVQKHYELQDHVSMLRGNHLLLFGGRFRDIQDSNFSTGGYNGEFIFPSIAAYEITQQGLASGLTPAQIRAQGGGASQFSITAGTPQVSVNVAELGLYFEDQWKLSPTMTLTPGLRFETQSGIPDHADFAPRVSYGWSIGNKDGKPALVVFRAGVGLFYQRFTSGLILNAARQNGILQQQSIVQNPDFYPNPPSPDALGPATLPTIFRINSSLHAPSLLQTSVGLEKQFSSRFFVHADYSWYRGIDQLLTRNINAPLPGTYNPDDPASGTRPLNVLQNIYEYQSQGESRRHELYITARYNTAPAILYGYFLFSGRDANTAGATSFPSDQYDLNADYGRAADDIHARAYLGGLLHLPFGFTANPFFIVESSAPFNITVGQDLNGDSQFNDRPAFATDLTRPSVYPTAWGNFDAHPMPGQQIIPINYGKAPAFVMLNGAFSRTISFGPRLEQFTPGKKAPRRFQWNLGVQFQNLFNNVNGGQPIGVLGSPLFGHSNNLSSTQFSNVQSNRILYLHSVLSF
ncbi:MAG: carboxypeptidase regulatory-like domain-containing protein [Acidobacteriaceae bacterium]